MRTFTHNFKDDTTLERDGDNIIFTFVNDGFTYMSDVYDFHYTQDELFEMLGEYFDEGKHKDVFDWLTLPAMDALWNALLWLNQRNLEV